MRNLSNAELRTWLQQLLDNITAQSDREVIRYGVKQGTKEKHGSRDI